MLSSASDDEVAATSASRDVRAADLQEKPTKLSRTKPVLPKQSFRRIRRRRRLPSEHRSERSERSNTASAASEAVNSASA